MYKRQAQELKTTVIEKTERESIQDIKILLAEDNELNQEVARILLEEEGAEVFCVNNGQKAVEVFSTHPAGSYDLILMDIMMPVMGGYEATRPVSYTHLTSYLKDIYENSNIYDELKEYYGKIQYSYSFNLNGSRANRAKTEKSIQKQLQKKFANCSIESRELSRESFYELYGGFLFIGIFLGIIFLMATTLII